MMMIESNGKQYKTLQQFFLLQHEYKCTSVSANQSTNWIKSTYRFVVLIDIWVFYFIHPMINRSLYVHNDQSMIDYY